MNKPVILCIDDEKIILDSLKAELKNSFDSKFILEIAESGDEALEIIRDLMERNIEVPLVISDQIMPGMKGDTLLIEIHRISPKTLTILLTGQAGVDAVGNAVNHANLYRYVPKPWEATDLTLTVSQAIKSFYQAKMLEEQSKELKQLVKELKDINETLERRVEERTTEIRKKNEEIIAQKDKIDNQKEILERNNIQLMALNEEKDYLIGVVAHDLRSPLNRINGLAYLIKGSYDNLNDEQKQFLDLIIESTGRLGKMIVKILDVKAIEANEIKITHEEFDLSDLLQKLFDNYLPIASDKKIELEYNPCNNTPIVFIDKNYTFQIFENLLTNAIKFSYPHSKIYLDIKSQNNSIIVEVKDEGPGISENDMKKLFGKFQKLTAKPTAGEESTGLGLSIVKKYVEAMDGKIWCKSEINKGASFFVEFPKI